MAREVRSQVGSRFRRFAPFASLLALAACSSVLGIEDLHQGPAPGGGGSSASGGDTTGTAGTNSTTNGGGSGTGQGGDNTVNGGSTANGGTAGDTTIGVAGDNTGQAGVGGGTTVGTPVTGHVIDYWGHELSGVPVEIGGTMVTTNAQGAFMIPNVAAEYDASLVVQFPDNYDGQIYGWVYQGLTRRDPTLQVYIGLQSQSADLQINAASLATTLTGTRTFTVSTAGVDDQDEFTEVDADFNTETATWRGPTTTQETAYGLIWQQDANGLPTSYAAFDSKPLSLSSSATGDAMLALDMSAKSITAAAITGTVTPGGAGTRANYAFLQFPTNAEITLLSDAGPNTFSYVMPTIANSDIVFAATEGDAGSGAYALVHKDGLAAGKTGISAQIPVAVSNLALTPAASVNKVDGTTQFSFHADTGNAGPFVIQFVNADNTLLKTDGLFIVTAKTSFTMPKVVNDSFALIPGDSYYWRVQTHGARANVDAMAVPTGFTDPFSGSDYLFDSPAPLGPHRGDGSFTISASQQITIAP